MSRQERRARARREERAHTGPAATGGEWTPTVLQVALLYLALGLLYMLPALLPGNQYAGSDYLSGGVFSEEFNVREFAAGRIPKWNPYIFGGVPVFANPGAMYYPLRLVVNWFPMTVMAPLLFALQFALGGLGAFLLARELGARAWVAALAGIAWEFTGIVASTVYAGHDGRMIVASLAPMFLFFLHHGIRTGRFASFAGAAATIGATLLSFQIQSNYYLLLAGAAWVVACVTWQGLWRAPRRLLARTGLSVLAVGFGFAMSAVNFLPFQSYVPESPRGMEGGRGYEYSTSFSMPPEETLGFAVPEQAGVLDGYRGRSEFKLHTEYLGALAIALTVLGLFVSTRDRRWRFLAGLAGIGMLFVWGGFTPAYRLIYAVVPFTARFRAPSIALFVVALALVVMAAITLERIAALRDADASRRGEGQRDPLDPVRRGTKLLWVLVSIAVGVSAAVTDAPGATVGWLRFAAMLAIVNGALVVWLRGFPTRAVAIILAIVTVVDLWVVDRRLFLTVPADDVFAADDIVEFLQRQPRVSRVWTFPFPKEGGVAYIGNGMFGVNTDYLQHFDLRQAGGLHGNQLHRWNQYVGGSAKEMVDWSNLLEHRALIDAAAIDWIVSGVEISWVRARPDTIRVPGLKPMYQGSERLRAPVVYFNESALPRAYLVPQLRSVSSGDAAMAVMKDPAWSPRQLALVEADVPPLPATPLDGATRIVSETPDEIVIRAEVNRPALLVVADNYYPGWEATIDGTPAAVMRTNYTFRGVILPAGDHEVRFRFRPRELYVGLAITATCYLLLAGWLVGWLVMRRRARQLASSPAVA